MTSFMEIMACLWHWARGSVRCLIFYKRFKIHESGGDCHGILFFHQPTDPLPVPEKVRESAPLASHIMIGNTQVIPISMLSGKYMEISPTSFDLRFILPSCPGCFEQTDFGFLGLTPGIVFQDTCVFDKQGSPKKDSGY